MWFLSVGADRSDLKPERHRGESAAGASRTAAAFAHLDRFSSWLGPSTLRYTATMSLRLVQTSATNRPSPSAPHASVALAARQQPQVGKRTKNVSRLCSYTSGCLRASAHCEHRQQGSLPRAARPSRARDVCTFRLGHNGERARRFARAGLARERRLDPFSSTASVPPTL